MIELTKYVIENDAFRDILKYCILLLQNSSPYEDLMYRALYMIHTEMLKGIMHVPNF